VLYIIALYYNLDTDKGLQQTAENTSKLQLVIGGDKIYAGLRGTCHRLVLDRSIKIRQVAPLKAQDLICLILRKHDHLRCHRKEALLWRPLLFF
jgi:hypothetical protein